jgi:rubrerythrin
VGGLDLARSLEELAGAATREGCCGETGAAMVAFVQAEAAEDPTVAGVLRTIAEEESDHAALAFAVVAWAIRAGGAPVRRAIEQAVAEHEEELVRAVAVHEQEPPAQLRAHGRSSPAEAARERLRALREIVHPSLDAMLAG